MIKAPRFKTVDPVIAIPNKDVGFHDGIESITYYRPEEELVQIENAAEHKREEISYDKIPVHYMNAFEVVPQTKKPKTTKGKRRLNIYKGLLEKALMERVAPIQPADGDKKDTASGDYMSLFDDDLMSIETGGQRFDFDDWMSAINPPSLMSTDMFDNTLFVNYTGEGYQPASGLRSQVSNVAESDMPDIDLSAIEKTSTKSSMSDISIAVRANKGKTKDLSTPQVESVVQANSGSAPPAKKRQEITNVNPSTKRKQEEDILISDTKKKKVYKKRQKDSIFKERKRIKV